MKLRNKKTGEIKAFDEVMREAYKWNNYNSLAELNAEWEDHEPKIKKYWWVSPLDCGVVEDDLKWNESEYDDEIDKFNVEIGNYFETEEEAEQAVRRLKAWRRLKDNGFEFRRWEIIDGTINFMILPKGDYREKVYEDLDICFGGKE